MPPSPPDPTTAPDDAGSSALLRSLVDATREAPTDRKLLLAPTRGGGKELLRAVARSGTPWLGWEVLTLRPFALEIAGEALAGEGREMLDEVGEQALMDRALDGALEELPPGPFVDLAEGVGFRAAVRGAVQALRLAGVSPAAIRGNAALGVQKRDALAAVLERYEASLDTPADGARRVDTAFVIRAATRLLREGAPMGYDRIWLLPGLSRRGLAGRLVAELERRGARALEADPVRGLERPEGMVWSEAGAASPLSWIHRVEDAPADDGAVSLDLFHAAGVTDELKEVLRRVMAAGLAWDQVEIVATDAGVYGPALHALAGRMGIPVTFGVGLPVERTRTGQAVERFFRWIEDDFPSPVLRGLLQAGTLRPPEPWEDAWGAALARRLRRLRVGWGRDRYLPALDAALESRRGEPEPRRKETAEEARERVARERRELRALRALVAPVLDALPPLPRRLDPDPPKVSPARLARALAVFLERVPRRGEVERTALDRLDTILRRVGAELTRPTDFAAAVTVLREHLAIRVPAPRAEGPAPWRSTGGHLYLSDLEHGGASGRAATFVVGLDAGRTAPSGFEDPLLLDAERRALAPGLLPTSRDRLRDARFRLAALLAGLRGAVTLSHAAWDPGEARTLLPSPLVLQAHRLDAREPGAGYDALAERLGDPVAAVPRPGAAGGTETGTGPDTGTAAASVPVDAADLWLAALSRDGRLLRGVEAVRSAFPGLDRGLRARDALERPPSPHTGQVRPRPGLDPRRSGDPVSASRMEALGACPRRYFLRYVLKVDAPRDPSLDPDAWLDALERGSLLHRVYESTLRLGRERDLDFDEPAFEALALEVLADEVERLRRRIPPPSRVVLEREIEALRADARAFVTMVRAGCPRWLEAELSFGMPGDERPPVEIPLPGGAVHVRGAIDRVDEKAGGLQLVDYKTGRSPRRYEEGGTYHGGRRLQHVLYTRAADRMYDRPVHGLDYHFPTRDAENAVVRYPRQEVEDGLDLVARLLDGVAAGRFLPTEDEKDCRFCAYQPVCRVRDDGRSLESPLARYGAARFEEEPFDLLREVRRWSE